MPRWAHILLVTVLVSACAGDPAIDDRLAARVQMAWVISAVSLFAGLFPDLVAVQRGFADRTTIRMLAGAVFLLSASVLLEHHGIIAVTSPVAGLADNG